MPHYFAGYRKYPTGNVIDGIADVIQWQTRGSGGDIPLVPGTHKRLYRNWYFYDGLIDTIVWQNAGSGGVAPPAPATAAPEGPHGPGWKLFGHEDQAYHPPWTKRRPEYEKLRRVLAKAEDAETRVERREAAKELKTAVADLIDREAQQSAFAAGLRQLQAMNLSLAAYVAEVAQIVAAIEAEQDDMEAIQMIIELL